MKWIILRDKDYIKIQNKFFDHIKHGYFYKNLYRGKRTEVLQGVFIDFGDLIWFVYESIYNIKARGYYNYFTTLINNQYVEDTIFTSVYFICG